MLVYQEKMLKENLPWKNSEEVLRFNIETFNKYFFKAGESDQHGSETALIRLDESLSSMRELGSQFLFLIILKLINIEIKNLQSRKNQNYSDRQMTNKAIANMIFHSDMFNQAINCEDLKNV